MALNTVSKEDVPHPGDQCPECEEAVLMEIERGEIHCPSGDCATTWKQMNSTTWRKSGGRQ